MPREKLIGCRVTDAEHATITAAAHAAGHRDVSSHLRTLLGLTTTEQPSQQQQAPTDG